MGYQPLPTGKKRLEITRILNTNFDIDNYTSREWRYLSPGLLVIESLLFCDGLSLGEAGFELCVG